MSPLPRHTQLESTGFGDLGNECSRQRQKQVSDRRKSLTCLGNRKWGKSWGEEDEVDSRADA